MYINMHPYSHACFYFGQKHQLNIMTMTYDKGSQTFIGQVSQKHYMVHNNGT